MGWNKFTSWQKTWFVSLLLGFWIFGAARSIGRGKQIYEELDGTSEIMTVFAARNYVDEGFFKNYLLPVYPPFGFDAQKNPRKEPFVYTHFLPGQAWVLGLVLKIFGKDAVWIARLIPHTLTVSSIALIALEIAAYANTPILACIMATALLLPRSLTIWSIGIHSHSYILAFYLLLMALLLRMVNQKNFNPKHAWGLGVGFGVLQMLFGFDWVPLTFISIASFYFLFPAITIYQAKRVFLGFFIGSSSAFLFQLLLCSFHFGSLNGAILDYWQWGKWRVTGYGVEDVQDAKVLRVAVLLKEYNRQTYGATGFTAYNLVGMSLGFLILGFLGKLFSKTTFIKGAIGVVLAFLSAASWTLLMRHHAWVHIFYVPRHYFVLYLTFLLVMLPIACKLVHKSRNSSI